MDKSKLRQIANDEIYVSQRKYYQEIYNNETDTPWENAFDTEWLKKTLGTIGRRSGRWALEIGAGSGRGSMTLGKAGYHTVGIDYVFKPLVTATNRRGEKFRPLFVHADFFEYPFKSGVFDLALDWGVFHHIRRGDTDSYLETVKGTLKKEGRYLLGCFSEKFRHKGEKRRKRNWLIHHGHYDRFSTREELVKVLNPFFIIESITEDVGGFYLVHMTARRDQ